MDELVRHCLRELSFDGDLGCDVTRLRDFIAEFYTHQAASAAASSSVQGGGSRAAPGPYAQGQHVDDAFCAFVWSVVVQQLGVRVGTVPDGAGGAAEVFIAPQASAARKAKAKGEEAPSEEAGTAAGLDIVDDAALRSLEDLRGQYGDRLRIAVDPETTFVALTGSHIRPSKLTPMIYTGLQIITRGREKGVSVLQIGKTSGYDQKTCFYIIKQLVDLNLVVKLRQPGVSGNICVHKYFYDRSPIWQQVLTEEQEAISKAQAKDADGDSEEDEDGEDTKPFTPVHFDPIDSRHLSSLPVLKSRLTRLLKDCPHQMHTSNNLMVKIGFVNPTKSDRRFFRTRLRELEDEGFIERVQVAHADRKRFPDKKVLCVRLMTNDPSQADGMLIDNEEIQEIEPVPVDDDTGMTMTTSIHRQIIDCLTEVGTKGMTLNEISAALGDFDRRTIDLLINRLAKDAPPAHLADLGVAQLAETHGRERRYKYYTAAHYHALADKEGLDIPDTAAGFDTSAVGGFMTVGAEAFYEDEAALEEHLQVVTVARSKGKGKGKETGRGKKGKKRVNPILPDGSVKRGRPRKSVAPADEDGDFGATPSKKGRKRKREAEGGEGAADAEGTEEPPPKKRRGRPPKNPPAESASQAEPSTATPSIPKKRGRPPKKPAEEQANAEAGPSSITLESPSQGPTPKRRGRPPKKVVLDTEPAPQAPGDVGSPSLTPAVPGPAQEGVPDMSTEEPPAEATPSAATAPQDTPSATDPGRRRSARTPKVRKRGNSLSPVRTSTRRTRQSTTTVSATPGDGNSVDQMQVDAEPVVSSIADMVDVVEAALNQTENPASLVDEQPVHSPGESASTAPLMYAGFQIDPALLATGKISLLAREHSLISMTPEPSVVNRSIASTPQDPSKKRGHLESASVEPASKRTKSESKFRGKANISQSRRESEILRLLADADGIMNTSCKEFFEAHAALVDNIIKAGEEASTRPGARIDKRTLDATLRELEAKEKLKIVTTSVQTLTGGTRMARIVYLPDTTPDALSVFLSSLGQELQVHQPTPSATPFKTLDTPLAYGGSRKQRPSRASVATTLEPADTQPNAEDTKIPDMAQLFEQDDDTVRDALLMDKNTAAQSYGYLAGRAVRAHAMHSLTVELFEKNSPSAQVVSHEHRIIHLSYYFTDIPISVYCSLVAVIQPIEELGQLLQSPTGRDTPTHSVSETIRKALAPAQAKSRARLLSLLDMLRTLGLVTPLTPSDSAAAAFSCPQNAQYPTSFNVVPDDEDTPTVAPLYWKLNDTAPIRLWAIGDGLPPVWKQVPVSSSEQVAAYWSDLERVSQDQKFAEDLSIFAPSSTEDANDDVKAVMKSLRRQISWSAVHNLSFYQTEYLRRYIDPATGNTPLEDPDQDSRNTQIKRLARIVSASPDVLTQWFEKARKKHLRDLKKLKRASGKGKQRAGSTLGDEDAGAVLARRAAEARERRERDWAEMVQRVHPEPLRTSAAQRVHRLRGKFINGSGKASEKWEGRIREAIREADIVAEGLLGMPRSQLFGPAAVAAGPAPPVPVASAVQEKDVDELIAAQGPRVPQDSKTGQKTRKGKEKETSKDPKAPRRHRFLWNRDYDELVRDGSAVIKARCRNGTRLDWGAMEQVFPAVPRNSVRQRLVHLKETPGTEAYLARLEEKWYDVWVQNRGTEELPDPDPESATNFDLATHIKFLRKHIDKNAIRVGFVEVDAGHKINLPASIEDIARHFDVVEKVQVAPPWDFMWSVVAEEAREKLFAHHAFTSEVEEMPPAPSSYASDIQHVADAAVKMALGNPNETYDMDVASELLKTVGEERVKTSTTDLLNRGVLAKVIRDVTKQRPGRTLKISDSNLNSLGGQLPRELFQDSTALEDTIVQQDQQRAHGEDVAPQEWPLLATDGDTAFLLELASEGKVRFDVDTSHPRAMRAAIDWNSKKADDDDIETAVRVRYVDIAAPPPQPDALADPHGQARAPDDEAFSPAQHGVLADGAPAFCRDLSSPDGLVDCPACLAQAHQSLLAQLSSDEKGVAEQLVSALRDAGPAGLTREQLSARFAGAREDTLLAVTRRIVGAGLAHWVGYTAVVLVAAAHVRPWTVSVATSTEGSGEEAVGSAPDADVDADADAEDGEADADGGVTSARKSMIFPRRWLDIYGRKLPDAWDAAARGVVGLILLRPGISQAEIRWRLRAAYDRQEVGEVLQALREDGQITARVADAVGGGAAGARRAAEDGPADEREEKLTFWFLAGGERRWYQV